MNAFATLHPHLFQIICGFLGISFGSIVLILSFIIGRKLNLHIVVSWLISVIIDILAIVCVVVFVTGILR